MKLKFILNFQMYAFLISCCIHNIQLPYPLLAVLVLHEHWIWHSGVR